MNMRDLRLGLVVTLALGIAACGDDDGDDHGDHDHDKDAAVDSGANDDAGQDAGQDAGDKDAEVDAGDGNITINFKGVVGAQPFACGTHYDNIGTPGHEITPVDFRFYLSDVKLLKADDSEVALTLDTNDWQYQNVGMIDFEDAAGACEQGDTGTNTKLTGTAPAGDYVGVKFTVGIPQALNHADLVTQPSPLNKSSLFWGWNMGHVFFAAVSRAEGVLDTDAGVDDAGVGGDYDHVTHMGATGCDGNPVGGVAVTTCAKSNRPVITLKGLDFKKDFVVVDFAEVKKGSDVVSGGPCHSFTADTCTVPFAHVGVDFATGMTNAMQSVFRAE